MKKILKQASAAIIGLTVLTGIVLGVFKSGDLLFTTALDISSQLPMVKEATQKPSNLDSNINADLNKKADVRQNSLENEAVPVMSSIKTTQPPESGSNISKQVDFFSDFRMDREKIRSQQLELLREIVNNSQSSSETRQEAQNRILQITKDIQKEAEAERLILAGGIADVIVSIQPNSASVIIKSAQLSQKDRSLINEIASRVTGFSAEQIHITLNK